MTTASLDDIAHEHAAACAHMTALLAGLMSIDMDQTAPGLMRDLLVAVEGYVNAARPALEAVPLAALVAGWGDDDDDDDRPGPAPARPAPPTGPHHPKPEPIPVPDKPDTRRPR